MGGPGWHCPSFPAVLIGFCPYSPLPESYFFAERKKWRGFTNLIEEFLPASLQKVKRKERFGKVTDYLPLIPRFIHNAYSCSAGVFPHSCGLPIMHVQHPTESFVYCSAEPCVMFTKKGVSVSTVVAVRLGQILNGFSWAWAKLHSCRCRAGCTSILSPKPLMPCMISNRKCFTHRKRSTSDFMMEILFEGCIIQRKILHF